VRAFVHAAQGFRVLTKIPIGILSGDMVSLRLSSKLLAKEVHGKNEH
jgi:hypothetical protein